MCTGSIEALATTKRALGLADPLTKLGWHVGICLEQTHENMERAAHEASSAEILPYSSGSVLSENGKKLSAVVRFRPSHVYWVTLGWRSALALAALRGRRHVVEQSELLSSNLNISRLARLSARALEALGRRGADAQICASSYLMQLKANKKSSRLYLPYAGSRPTMDGPVHAGGGGQMKSILYMGTLSENYGVLDLIVAWSRVCTSGRAAGCRLIICGEGRDRGRAEELANKLLEPSAYVINGFVPEPQLKDLLAQASAFVCPLRDTVQDKARCPSKLFIYAMYQRPVITCPIGEALEVYGRDYAFYYSPGDVSGMAACLQSALSWDGDTKRLPTPADHTWEARAKELDRMLEAANCRPPLDK